MSRPLTGNRPTERATAPEVTLSKPVKRLSPIIILAVALLPWTSDALADVGVAPNSADALSGVVKSRQEGAMQGVLVQINRQGGNVAYSVLTDARGRFSFPRDWVGAGAYTISVRAIGYDLSGKTVVSIAAKGARSKNLDLVPAADVSGQYTSADWLSSAPPSTATAVDQRFFLNMCTHCHTVTRVLQSPYNAEQANQTIARMAGYAVGSTPERPQLLPPADAEALSEIGLSRTSTPGTRALADYIAKVNLSKTGATPFVVKPQARPSGDATHVRMTTFTLPRPGTMPHDVIVDKSGAVWYSDFGNEVLGKLDPATGKVVEYKIPELKPQSPKGSLDIQFDKDGMIWIAMMYQGAVARFNPHDATFKVYSAPASLNNNAIQFAMVSPEHLQCDGKVWINDSGRAWIHRLDLKSGKFETFKPFAGMARPRGTGVPHLVYGIGTDADNNLFFADWGDSLIGRIDAKTSATSFFTIPTEYARPRRVYMDDSGGFWFAEWQGGKVGRFDTRTDAFHEWSLPNAMTAPYDVMPDGRGYIWTGGMASDRIDRVSASTGAVTEYLLPGTTNVRRVFVDTSSKRVAFWVGDNNGGTITKLEPLDGL